MHAEETDIFVSGGGIAGLVAALGLADAGLSVTLADPAPPPAGDNCGDLRSTAFLEPSRRQLEAIGIWNALGDVATPLEVLCVANCMGDPPWIETERSFRAADLGIPALGWNLPNAQTRRRLADLADSDPRINLKFGVGFHSLLARQSEAVVDLTDGSRIRARLAIAADGSASPLREAAGIEVETTRYGQKALTLAVSHPLPHKSISTELYLSGGAFVLVPLPDQNGVPTSAVVWMHDGPEVLRLAKLDDGALGEAATQRSCNVLGPLSPVSDRQVWPVVTQRARRYTARRVAVIAEAAHVLPPIGAQGLNVSLADIWCLLQLVRDAPGELGTSLQLSAFARHRQLDVLARTGIIDLYNRLCRDGTPAGQFLRSTGLRLAGDWESLRRAIMRAGLES
ncbi:MAG: UbiH/UbiF family hydroxylase [Boseongicola sp. SB0664_bin_43]|uniref:UbiH/UbiF family hydroxylase n=1 Tax=Boseongicola sp. SB0664_bin_43 TaxID=2604844 RepID=A0A6B0Y0U4_9RHOB|nr:UbiH/UbiF family hydroxylase [Boseongicola sp. SB0664_bin_43]